MYQKTPKAHFLLTSTQARAAGNYQIDILNEEKG